MELPSIRQKGNPPAVAVPLQLSVAVGTKGIDFFALNRKRVAFSSSTQYRFVIIIFITSSFSV